MFKLYSALFLVLSVSFQISAQCNGIYFKESKRQIFSNPFAYWYSEDFDNDGLKDVLGFTPGSNQYHYYKRTTADSFDTTSKITAITNIGYSVFGDVNNDGKKDFIVTHPNNPPILTTYLNDGTGKFTTNTPAVNVNGNESFFAAGDLNNDGKQDVLSTTFDSSTYTSTLYYRLVQPDNSFGAAVMITNFYSFVSGSSWRLGRNIVIEDLNNDGLKDIAFVSYAVINQPVYTLKVLTNSVNTTFTETLSTSLNLNSNSLNLTDLNNDGKKDFISNVFQDTGNPNIYKLKILSNNGDTTFGSSEIVVPATYSVTTYYFNDFAIADFNADGTKDIILPGAKKYLFLKNQGNFSFTQEEFKSYLNANSAEMIDGDGKADMLSFEKPLVNGSILVTSQNALYFLYNSVRFRKNVCNPIGQTKTVDFDGDGFTDRAFWNPSNGTWRYYTENSQNNQVYFQWGLGSLGDVPTPGDYDGDGQTDYAVFRKPTGTWYIRRSSDQQATIFKFGITEDKPVPADYDGDGKADIAVFRPSEGNWYIWLSLSNQFFATHFGISEDKPVPADFDGDGKADLSVFRPSGGIWYRLNSSNSSFFAVQYGIGTDKPIPGDFDADGKDNIAVYRDGTWYVLRDNFSTSVFFWGTANDVPFFGNNFLSTAFVYRRTDSSIYAMSDTSGFVSERFFTGSSFNEILVSSILPPE